MPPRAWCRRPCRLTRSRPRRAVAVMAARGGAEQLRVELVAVDTRRSRPVRTRRRPTAAARGSRARQPADRSPLRRESARRPACRRRERSAPSPRASPSSGRKVVAVLERRAGCSRALRISAHARSRWRPGVRRAGARRRRPSRPARLRSSDRDAARRRRRTSASRRAACGSRARSAARRRRATDRAAPACCAAAAR